MADQLLTVATKLKAVEDFSNVTVQELANYLKNLLVKKQGSKISTSIRAALVERALAMQCKQEGLEPNFENKLYYCLLVLKWTKDESNFCDYILWLNQYDEADYQQINFGLLLAGL